MFRHLTETQILAWADVYREATGHWPTNKSGRIAGTVCETWAGVDRALRLGQLGLEGGSSLAKLLVKHRGARYASYVPPLTEDEILDWADKHDKATGNLPTVGSGAVRDVPFECWANIDDALRQGSRGLPGGSSLAKLLAERRGARNLSELPPLTTENILVWAVVWFEQKGKWPTENSGLVPNSGGETWLAVDTALRNGNRGLPGGSSLPRLLAQEYGVRNKTNLPTLTVPLIMVWADAHFKRTGKWPTVRSGAIPEAPGETWGGINAALVRGTRGLPCKTTLARLLAAQRNRRNHMDLPPLIESVILDWADAYFDRTGDYPGAHSGPIPEAPGETWLRVETALRDGLRGLPGGNSLAQLLAEHRGKRNIQRLPPLRIKRIVAWAFAHFERKGEWPIRTSGPISEAPGETWLAVDTALRDGVRGLPGGSSLAKMLARKCGTRNRKGLPLLLIDTILAWADRYLEQTGHWPTHSSGPIPGTNGETWRIVDKALRQGSRGLPGGSSLAGLLHEHRGKRNHTYPPPLSLENVRTWVETHRQETGHLPSKNSGPIAAAPGETWLAVDWAFRKGHRGLPGPSSLAQFLDKEFRAGKEETGSPPNPLSHEGERGSQAEDLAGASG